jgi:hypothetical protein
MELNLSEAFIRNALVDQLESMGQRVRGNSCTCPWHEDRTPSAGIFEDDTGHWRVKCFACDRSDDVYGLRDEKPTPSKEASIKVPRIEQKPTHPMILADKKAVKAYCERDGIVTAWHKYGLPDALVLVIARIEQANGKKTFRQFTPHGDGFAVGGLVKEGLPLYRQHDLIGEPILVVEGEKAADAAWSIGIPATTSSGGSTNAAKTDWSALAGKRVVLWPDNDPPGEKYMDEVQAILGDYGCVISRIDPVDIGIKEKGDIADMVALWPEKGEREQCIIQTLMDDAGQRGALAEMEQWHADILSGKWKSLEFPLRSLGLLSRAALPGAVTLICADPGAGKSWLMLQLLQFWHEQGVKSVVRMFEDSIYVHMARILAQLTGEGGHTDDAWIRTNAPALQSDMSTHRKTLAVLGSRIIAESDELWGAKEVIAWAERSAKGGARVLMLDPITAIKQGKEPWLQDFELAMQLKGIAKKYGATIIITTHPRGAAKEPSLTGMAGGVAWSRFAHTVLWLEKHHQHKEVPLWSGGSSTINRSIHILKCRHGKGDGASIGAEFGRDVIFREVGIILPEGQEVPQNHQEKRPPIDHEQRMKDAEEVF